MKVDRSIRERLKGGEHWVLAGQQALQGKANSWEENMKTLMEE